MALPVREESGQRAGVRQREAAKAAVRLIAVVQPEAPERRQWPTKSRPAGIPERLLAHGPCLADIDDLLCFDKIVYPVTKACVRPRSLAPGRAGYPLREPLPEAVRELLANAGLITSPGPLLFDRADAALRIRGSAGTDVIADPAQPPLQEMTAIIGEIYLSTLPTPATDAEVLAWQHALDANVKRLAVAAGGHGHRVTGKYHIEDVTWTLKPGWTQVLSLVFPTMPRLRAGQASLEDIIGFLTDEGTKERRRRLFDSCLGSDCTAEGGGRQSGNVVDLLIASYRDYRDWLGVFGLCAGTRTVELLIAFDESLVNDIVQAGVPEERRGELRIQSRGLALEETRGRPPGCELAFISHAKRKFMQLWPS